MQRLTWLDIWKRTYSHFDDNARVTRGRELELLNDNNYMDQGQRLFSSEEVRHKAVYNAYYFYFILSPCQEFSFLYFKSLQNCKMHLVTSSIFPWYQQTKSSLTLPHSHQSLNMFKSCLVKDGLKLFPS